jgi:hypothetical protein
VDLDLHLDPTPPFLIRQRLRARWARRRLGYWLARQLRRLDPLPRPTGVVSRGYAQGRTDLQLTHRNEQP